MGEHFTDNFYSSDRFVWSILKQENRNLSLLLKKRLTAIRWWLEYAPPTMSTAYRRAVSSVGRAMPLQGMGHKFESCTAHQ